MKLWQQKVLVIPSSIAICGRGFSKQLYQGLLVSFIEVGHFRCFDVSIIMRDKVREYGLEGNI